MGLIFFASVAEAMQATVEFLELKPASIEHIDRVLFDQTKGQLEFKAARDLLADDAVAERLQLLSTRRLGLRTTICKSLAEINLVLGMRKAGLTLLTGRKGDAKPVTCIEDTAVHPEQLPAYAAAQHFSRRAMNTCRPAAARTPSARRSNCAPRAMIHCARTNWTRR